MSSLLNTEDLDAESDDEDFAEGDGVTVVWRSRPFTFLLWAEGGRKGSGESSTPDLC